MINADERRPGAPEAPPSWFHGDEPWAESEGGDTELYWACGGAEIAPPSQKKSLLRKLFQGSERASEPKGRSMWISVYKTAEEALAGACRPNSYWRWDGKPPKTLALRDWMEEARRDNRLGVALKCFNVATRQWDWLHYWPVDEPLL